MKPTPFLKKIAAFEYVCVCEKPILKGVSSQKETPKKSAEIKILIRSFLLIKTNSLFKDSKDSS